jgi:bifunctional non-homologous end joining protein LigD
VPDQSLLVSHEPSRYWRPIYPDQVVSFNTDQGWSRDLWSQVAAEMRRRCDLQLCDVPSGILDYVERHEDDLGSSPCGLAIWNFELIFANVWTFNFCVPTRGTKVPCTADWLQEIKYDGCRLRVERSGDRVRLITRNAYDWTKRFPWIVAAARKNQITQFVIDGEAVTCASTVSRISMRCIPASTMMSYSSMPSTCRRWTATISASYRLERLLRGRPDGMFVAPFEQSKIGPDPFRQACRLGLECGSQSGHCMPPGHGRLNVRSLWISTFA